MRQPYHSPPPLREPSLARSPVCALVEGSPRRPLRVWGPFSLGGPEFLRQRLFPVYPIHREVREHSSEWERELRRVLGEPVDENAHAVVFALSPAASGVGAPALP